MAGVLNVRADRSIQWPEKQEIGNLQLNFIKLAPKANPLKRAVISASPLLVGLLAIWVIAVNIFQVDTVIAIASSGQLEDVARAVGVLTSAPDFWLWFYISFTIANTMFPTISKDMQGWWQIAGGFAVILVTLVILGIGQSLLTEITLTIGQLISSLSVTLILTITINLIMVMLLGLIEYTVERVTGHSATFQKGKMITMTREEALQRKEEEQKKRLTARSTSRRRLKTPDLVSVYVLELPIPGPPGQEPITKGVAAVLGMETADALPDTIDDDEIIETTATDSSRQRMLELFPESQKANDGDVTSISLFDDEDDSIGLLPAPSSKTQETDSTQAKSKPEFEVKAFSDPSETETLTTEEITKPPQPASTSITKPSLANAPKKPVVNDRPEPQSNKQITQKKSPEKPPQTTPLKADKSGLTESKLVEEAEDKGQKPKVDKPIQNKTDVSSVNKITSSQVELSLSSLDDNEEDEKETLAASSAIKINKPVQPSKPSLSDIDDDEQLSTSIKSQSSAFNLGNLLEGDEEEDEDAEDSLAFFSRPFARPVSHSRIEQDDSFTDLDDDDEDEELFARPFAPQQSTKDNDKGDDKDDDEQLSSRLPKSTSTFGKSSSTTPSWRSQLTTPLDEDNDDEDEQLSTQLPKRPSPFGKPSSATPSWRSQLTTPLDDDSDNDEDDDEQLSARLTKRPSMFEALNKTTEDAEDNPAKPRPSTSRPKSTRSSFKRVPKPTRKTDKPTSNWRDKFSEDNDDEIKYEPIDDDVYLDDDDDAIYYDDDDDNFYDDDDDNFYDDDL